MVGASGVLMSDDHAFYSDWKTLHFQSPSYPLLDPSSLTRMHTRLSSVYGQAGMHCNFWAVVSRALPSLALKGRAEAVKRECAQDPVHDDLHQNAGYTALAVAQSLRRGPAMSQHAQLCNTNMPESLSLATNNGRIWQRNVVPHCPTARQPPYSNLPHDAYRIGVTINIDGHVEDYGPGGRHASTLYTQQEETDSSYSAPIATSSQGRKVYILIDRVLDHRYMEYLLDPTVWEQRESSTSGSSSRSSTPRISHEPPSPRFVPQSGIHHPSPTQTSLPRPRRRANQVLPSPIDLVHLTAPPIENGNRSGNTSCSDLSAVGVFHSAENVTVQKLNVVTSGGDAPRNSETHMHSHFHLHFALANITGGTRLEGIRTLLSTVDSHNSSHVAQFLAGLAVGTMLPLIVHLLRSQASGAR
ncbi:hypothetical protein NMY22_g3635 [Coprinellus aureogranulatus]|nr:hypothetical protein NMY22_g3635 [Coprinellus aureogranulatus]